MATEPIPLVELQDDLLSGNKVNVSMLRLDLTHPFISGNKWYKLKYNLQEAIERNAKRCVSFGGVWSNHLHALAYAGQLVNMPTIGLVRGEDIHTATLEDCRQWGMDLHFISREQYRQRYDEPYLLSLQRSFPDAYFIPEGGNNVLGRQGCAEILEHIDLTSFSHIACAVGTGATLAGLADASLPEQKVMGFAAIKNAAYLAQEIQTYTSRKNWELYTEFHEGGFARMTPELQVFINSFQKKITLNSIACIQLK